jgi:hypothetical protein
MRWIGYVLETGAVQVTSGQCAQAKARSFRLVELRRPVNHAH